VSKKNKESDLNLVNPILFYYISKNVINDLFKRLWNTARNLSKCS
jgi:hypothetical protein